MFRGGVDVVLIAHDGEQFHPLAQCARIPTGRLRSLLECGHQFWVLDGGRLADPAVAVLPGQPGALRAAGRYEFRRGDDGRS